MACARRALRRGALDYIRKPFDPDEMFEMAVLAERLGDWQLVTDWCNRSIAKEANNPLVHHKRARACINLDFLEEAANSLKRASIRLQRVKC